MNEAKTCTVCGTVTTTTCEVRFNHGLAVSGDRPGLSMTLRVLRMALGHTDDDEYAEAFESLWTDLSERGEYTEGHKPVRATFSEEDAEYLRLAHGIAYANQHGDFADHIQRNGDYFA